MAPGLIVADIMGPGLIVAGILILFLLVIIASGMFTVQQQTHAVVECFGRFRKISPPGLNFKWPLIESIAGRVTHRVQELEIKVESKTKDDVFVDLIIAVQYYVPENPEAVRSAFYRLTNPRQQISSYVFDTVRALVPDMAVDHVFAEKDKIAQAVKDRLQDTMQQFGFTILQSLVNDIQPDAKVKDAMNQVNASARLKEAAKNEAEAQKIRVIAAAEAEARAKELQGVGIARQRLAIANGLKESVAACSEAGISPEEATKMVLLTQHYDTVTAVGAHSKSTIMMVPYSPQGMSQVSEQITAALLTTAEAERVTAVRAPKAPPSA
ncbi:MAG TPA: SPFH domain-containing protein [Phycisphaerae bacterium]|mgnify:CR=1 FL=1|nr:SPFH domain-containing protein [Phycisphaerae bacterium]HPM23223.1 SPFH domain-containing protein [Phycisphaerae bacterium]